MFDDPGPQRELLLEFAYRPSTPLSSMRLFASSDSSAVSACVARPVGVVGALLGDDADRLELWPVVSVRYERLEVFERPGTQIALWLSPV